jgi:phage shock protein PspC (stress-responsive transcriptional regulator)/two-component sensor histidine kinase
VNVHSTYQAGPVRPARLTRGTDKVIAGVCSGLASYLGIDTVIVRVAFVILTITTGLGIPAYIAAWILMPEPDPSAPKKAERLAKKVPSPEAAAQPRRDRGLYQGAAVGMIVLGCLLLLRNADLVVPDHVLWPLALAGAGAAVVWTRSSGGERVGHRRWASRITGRPGHSAGRPLPLVRLAVGVVLVLAGGTVFLGGSQAATGVFEILVAMLVAMVGLGLLLGPWMWHLAADLSVEKRERIRQEERADIAAHLHDSVLQTLALIQRSADNPRQVSALARRQERELRSWLYGDPSRRQNPTTLFGAIEAMVEEVESLHGAEVEVITVGDDCPLYDRPDALVKATREAVVNAAKHSGANEVSVYVEAETDRLIVFVRDRGKGFDPEAVPADRRGISQSITRRLERQGGRAVIWSAAGEGTEVQLEVPRG